jgi:hypothetical protein
MRKAIITASVTAALSLLSLTPSSAMPIATNVAPSAQTILVSGGCGIHFHRGPYGGCRMNGAWAARQWGWGGPGWGWYGGWRY